MNIGFIGLLMMILVLAAIMSNKVHPVIAMIVIPVVLCYVVGQGAEVGTFITNGIRGVATTGTMFMFSVLFFGIITDAGTFDPIVEKILKVVGNDPMKITIGTAILAMIIHLDGSGVVTFMITIPTMMPLYDKLGMRRMTLALVTAMSAGVMNQLPWGGPTMRAITSLESSVPVLFNPMIIGMVVGLFVVLVLAVVLGKQERVYVKNNGAANQTVTSDDEAGIKKAQAEKEALKRPKLFWINVILVIVTIVVMLKAWIPTHLAFMLAFSLALIINYPDLKEQGKRIAAHSSSAMLMASIIFASGVLNGILAGTGMSDGITAIILSLIPEAMGRFIPIIIGLISVPLMFIIPVDAFYYGVIPILANVTTQFGLPPEMVARAALTGHSTVSFPLTPTSGAAVLLVGMTEISWGDWQRKGIPIAMAISWIMLLVLAVTGAVVSFG
jgi:citrate transporter, CitMHS family